MREILFRGKSVQGIWVYGYYFAKPILEKHFIEIGEEQFLVIPETIGQYTGLKDKNGQRIFEGDIIQTAEYGREASGKNYSGKDTFCVRYEHGGFCIENSTRQFSLKYNEKMEIIGNIRDNPELLDTTEV